MGILHPASAVYLQVTLTQTAIPRDDWSASVCVCVCDPLIAKSFMSIKVQGGNPVSIAGCPTKEGYATADTGSDQPSVPASVSASAAASEVARGQAENPIRM